MLLHFVWDLKAEQMNMQCSLISVIRLELILYKFKLDHNSAEATKNICYVKGKSAVDHCNLMVQEILLELQEL